jgi:hypothetical protein
MNAKLKSMKWPIIFSVVVVVTLIVTIGFYLKSANKKTEKILNMHSTYDEPLIKNQTLDDKKVEALELGTHENLPNDIVFPFRSGTLASLSVPDMEASSSAFKQQSISGFQIISKDYYGNIFHFLKLDDAQDLCNRLSEENPHHGLFVLSKKKIDTKIGSSYLWELVNQKGTSTMQANMCVVENKNQLWIVDLYFQKDIYNKTYNKVVKDMLDSFKYSK